jgi:hypothetical protein
MRREEFLRSAALVVGGIAMGRLPMPEPATVGEMQPFGVQPLMWMDGGTLDLRIVSASAINPANTFEVFEMPVRSNPWT